MVGWWGRTDGGSVRAAMDRAVQLRVAGQSYKVVSSAEPAALQRLADQVSAKMAELGSAGRPAGAPSMLLAALALAHELEEERARRGALERKTRDVLRRVLVRIDDALDATDGDGVDSAEPAASSDSGRAGADS